MANSYFQFSEFLTFKTPEAVEMFCNLAKVAEYIFDQDFNPDEPEDYDGICDKGTVDTFMRLPEKTRKALAESCDCGTFDYGTEGYVPEHMTNTVWVGSEENGNMDLAGEIASVVLNSTGDHDTVFTFSGAGTCSRPVVGEFGGSWLAVSSKAVRGGSTWDDAEQMANQMRAGK